MVHVARSMAFLWGFLFVAAANQTKLNIVSLAGSTRIALRSTTLAFLASVAPRNDALLMMDLLVSLILCRTARECVATAFLAFAVALR